MAVTVSCWRGCEPLEAGAGFWGLVTGFLETKPKVPCCSGAGCPCPCSWPPSLHLASGTWQLLKHDSSLCSKRRRQQLKSSPRLVLTSLQAENHDVPEVLVGMSKGARELWPQLRGFHAPSCLSKRHKTMQSSVRSGGAAAKAWHRGWL